MRESIFNIQSAQSLSLLVATEGNFFRFWPTMAPRGEGVFRAGTMVRSHLPDVSFFLSLTTGYTERSSLGLGFSGTVGILGRIDWTRA